jgi:subtilisin family serine protease
MRHLPAAAGSMLAVTYDRPAALANATALAARERQLGARLVHAYDFRRQNTVMRVIAVPRGTLQAVAATLRAQSGVRSVAVTGARRYPLTTTPYYTNDPYFTGFAPDYKTAPYSEGASVPGQWDMHAIGLEYAFGYSQSGNGSNVQNANALGSANIKIAIIDTGEDANHPELTSKIAYQHCVLTDPSGDPPSTGSYSTDEMGHGTDVSGIAAAATNNSFGFAGAGGNAVIYAYRVFPTPDDTCLNAQTADQQCGADPSDIATAIIDAVNHGVNVISMSLGGGPCGNGPGFAANGDGDPAEGAAVAEAIAANVIVVAAAGNAGGLGLDSPACDTGVIAVGATGLDDGSTTGTGSYTRSTSGASPTRPLEYVSSYSQFGTNNTLRSSAAWGIVAPGGDPQNNTDQDDLHWIENIWTTTPFDQKFAGFCNLDYSGASGDCRTLIAGTSMATPHVAGSIALILAVNSSYQSAAAMKSLLCSTADTLGDSHQGCGRLNVYRAMATALGDSSPP